MENQSSAWKIIDVLKIFPAILVSAIIFYYSSLPNPLPPQPSGGEGVSFDLNSFLHVCEYGLLSFLVTFGFKEKSKDQYFILGTILIAISDEIHQYFVPNRFFDVFDIIADIIGVILGYIAYLILLEIRNKISNNGGLNTT